MYITGGRENEVAVNTVDALNAQTGETMQIASLRQPRMWHAMASSGKHLYVLGGRGTDMKIMASCECFNPLVNA